jgi:hypothetical protein
MHKLEHLQTVMIMGTPWDLLTMINLKIEKLVRQDRELDLENNQIEEEKHHLEHECKQLVKAIGEFKALLEELNMKRVPLLPKEEELIPPFGSGDLSDSINASKEDCDRCGGPHGSYFQTELSSTERLLVCHMKDYLVF